MLNRLKAIDWSFIRNSSINSVLLTVGRILGFAFTFIIARVFSSSDLGYISYVITLGAILAILVKPFHQHILAYFIGKYNSDEQQLESTLGNIWTISIALTLLSLIIGIPILFYLDRLDWNVLFVFIGIVAFYGYWGVATGFLVSSRLLLVHIGSNAVQAILVIVAVWVFNVESTGPIIAIYGLSYFIPIVLFSLYRPININFHLTFDLTKIKEILQFSSPVWASHILYQVQISIGILLLEFYTDNATLGVYSLTATLVQVFGFIAQGMTLILMPKLAGMTKGRMKLITIAMSVAIVGNLLGLAIYMFLYRWFIISFFGQEYFLSLWFGFLMALGVILLGLHGILTNSLIGVGKPGYETISRSLIAPVVLISSLILIPSMSAIGAAIAQVLGISVGILVYIFFAVRHLFFAPKRKPEETT